MVPCVSPQHSTIWKASYAMQIVKCSRESTVSYVSRRCLSKELSFIELTSTNNHCLVSPVPLLLEVEHDNNNDNNKNNDNSDNEVVPDLPCVS